MKKYALSLLLFVLGAGIRVAAAQDMYVIRSMFAWQADNYQGGGNPGYPNNYCWNSESVVTDSIKGTILVHLGTAPSGTYYLTMGTASFRIDVANGALTATPPTNWTWNATNTSFTQGPYSALYAGPAGVAPAPYLEGGTEKLFPGRYGYSSYPRPFLLLSNTVTFDAIGQNGSYYTPRQMIATTAVATTPAQNAPQVIGDWYLSAGDAGVTNPSTAGSDARDKTKCVGDPVDAVSGAHVIHETPISIMGSTSPIELTVGYNSKTAAATTGFSKGWSHNYEARVVNNTTSKVDVRWSQYETVSYVLNSVDQKFVAATDGHLKERLTRNADGSVTIVFAPNQSCTFAADGLISEIKSQASTTSVTHTTLTHSVAGTTVVPQRVTEQNTGVYLDFAYLSYSDAWHPSVVTSSDGRTAQFTYDTLGRLTRITGATGMWLDMSLDQNSTSALVYGGYRADGTRVFENTFDSLGRVLTQKDGRGHITTFVYNTSNLQNRYTDVTDRTGYTRRYSYDSQQRLSQITEGSYATAFGYNSRGFRTSATDSFGVSSSVAYTPSGDVTSTTAPGGASDGATYDASGNLKTYQGAAGGQFTIGYNASTNDATTITAPDGAVTQIQYGAAHLPSAVVNPSGGITNFAYQNGRVAQVTDVAGNATGIAYGGMGLPQSVTNAKGGVTSYSYDGTGQVLSTTYADQTQTSATYNASGKLATFTDQYGKTTTLGYDGNNNLISVTNALGKSATFEYDNEDRLTASVTPLGERWTIQYDAQGHAVKAIDPTGVSATYDVDAAGKVTGVRDGKGVKQITYSYDTAGRVQSSSDFHGATTTYKYNPQGALAEVVDALGLGKWYFYDNQGRLNFVSHSSGLSTYQEYDAQGNVADFYNAAGQKTTIDHFSDNLASGLTTATAKHTAYDYDNLNQVSSVVSPSGATLTLSRNAMGQLTDATDAVGHITYTYDYRGAIKTVTEGAATITREYDDLGRMSAFVDGSGNRIEYGYDDDSRLHTLKYPDGKIVTYTYDGAGRMKTVTDWAGRLTTYSYDQNGRLTFTANANGTSESRIYSQDGSLQDLFHGSGSTIFYEDSFTYDPVGRIASNSKCPDAVASSAELPAVMTFDADNRLTSFNGTAVTFDDDGNMLTGPTATSPPSSGTYVYDARRRLIAAGGLNYTYDAENRRVTVASGASTTSFVYNPLPQLDEMVVRVGPNGAVTYFVHGLGLIGEETGGIFTTYHFDRLGSTVAQSNETGTILGQVRYSPYGAVTSQDPGIITPYLFCGRYGVQTDSTGLNYMRARYYNAQARRFINQDVLLGSTPDAVTLNRFAYAGSEPISRIDPWGTEYLDLVYVGTSTPTIGRNQEDVSGHVHNGTMTWRADDGAAIMSFNINSGGYKMTTSKVDGAETNVFPGVYLVDNERPNRGGLMRRDGVGFSFDVTPKFKPAAGRRQTEIRIHPDGGEPGTHGCVGLSEPAAKLIEFESVVGAYIRKHGGVELRVRDGAVVPKWNRAGNQL